jgi:hypothetical protein
MIVVVADAAFASKANIKLTRQQADFLVRPFARTWRFANRQALKHLVTHWPKKHDRRCWVPLEEPGRRWTYRNYTKWACLRHSGDVTSIWSKKRRNDRPKQTKILVTNLPNLRARRVVDVYRRRWSVELSIKLDKSVNRLDAIDAERPYSLKMLLHAWRIASILATLRSHTHNLKTHPTEVGAPRTEVTLHTMFLALQLAVSCPSIAQVFDLRARQPSAVGTRMRSSSHMLAQTPTGGVGRRS